MRLSPAPPDPSCLLADVTFCVVDLETTGGAPQHDAITEIGAVLVRGGETLGMFQTFVHPGIAIPARVISLTGITESMVGNAPRPEAVLPTFLEFAGSAVIVGHNVRFDLGFLNAALGRAGYQRLSAPSVDTCALARRLVRDEVPDCTLDTLAHWLRLDHHPTHRALTDALATTDLFHHLLERVAAYDVFRLDDLLSLPRLAGHPHAAKLRLTDGLPRRPGVYEFVDRDGNVVYVGKATNLRQRVRSYFGSDDRRTIRPMLTALHSVRHQVAPNPLVAEVVELRLLHRGRPRFNRAGALPTRPTWLTFTTDAFPRLTPTSRPTAASGSLGPFPTLASARQAQEAIETVVPVRRCTERLGSTVPIRLEPCPPAQLGVTCCPCSGGVSPTRYGAVVAAARRALCVDGEAVAQALESRMITLAAALRFEEAAITRDRLVGLRAAHRDRATHRALLSAGRLVLEIDGARTVVDRGRIVEIDTSAGAAPLPEPVRMLDPSGEGAATSEVFDPADLAESRAIARWLLRCASRWTMADGDARVRLVEDLERARRPGRPPGSPRQPTTSAPLRSISSR